VAEEQQDHAQRTRRCGAVIAELFARLDWPALGAAYCEGVAHDFFDEERRERLLEVGLQLADDLAGALPADGPRRSLYLGAAVAELVPILVERLVLEREVLWFTLPGPERDELERALRAVGSSFELDLPLPDPRALVEVPPRPCDHLWMVSVLTDPDAFPALHDELYERVGTPQATGLGDLAEERTRASALIDALLANAAPPCVLSTTDEELILLRPRTRQRGLIISESQVRHSSALMEDAIGLHRLVSLA
jgi:hypothetical protein